MKTLDELKKARDDLLPEVKFWNRNRLFLAWAFCAAIILTSGIEIVKIVSEDYFLIGMISLFVFGLIIIIMLTRILDKNSNDRNKTYDEINKIIRRLENKNEN